MTETEFKRATDAATGRITLGDIADACGVSENLIQRGRLDPGTSDYRNPPAGWQAAVAKLARERAAGLVRLADRLERET